MRYLAWDLACLSIEKQKRPYSGRDSLLILVSSVSRIASIVDFIGKLLVNNTSPPRLARRCGYFVNTGGLKRIRSDASAGSVLKRRRSSHLHLLAQLYCTPRSSNVNAMA